MGAQEESHWENPYVGVGLLDPGPIHLALNRGRPPARLPGPQVFPRHSASAGVGELLGGVVNGKTRGPLGGREGFHFPERSPGTL